MRPLRSAPPLGGSLPWLPACLALALSLFAGCVDSTAFIAVPPPTPAPRLPMNDTYLGSIHAPGDARLRPRFVWEPVTATVRDLHYELQYSTDRFFNEDLTTIETDETEHQPPTALAVSFSPPVGARYFWRVRACIRQSCSGYSRPWYVNVGRVRKDYNGDGYADLAAGVPGDETFLPNAGGVRLFFGRSGYSLNESHDRLLTFGLDRERRGGGIVETAGDLNGDGFADLIVGVPTSNPPSLPGDAFIYYGNRDALFTGSSDSRLKEGTAEDRFGSAVGALGDINGDGYGDVYVMSYRGYDHRIVYIYLGNAGRALDGIPDRVFAKTDPKLVAGTPGDVNGDGLTELIIGAPWDNSEGPTVGAAFLYYGASKETLSAEPGQVIPGKGIWSDYADSVASAGDVNGDGFADAMIGRYNDQDLRPGTVDLFLGSRSGLVLDTVTTLSSGFMEDHFGSETEGMGDANGDGFDDILIAADHSYVSGDPTGSLYMFVGSEQGIVAVPAWTSHGSTTEEVVYRFISAGDFNGDGLADLASGAQLGGGRRGKVSVHLSREGRMFNDSPDTTLRGLTGTDGFGHGLASCPSAEARRHGDIASAPMDSRQQRGRTITVSR